MKIQLIVVGLSIVCSVQAQYVDKVSEPEEWVNPLMGSDSRGDLSNGNTYPAVGLPWGMNCWTAQTGEMGDGWQYTYDQSKIVGFKETHQPSPWMNDFGEFSLMPVTHKAAFTETDRASWFSHKAETAKPYSYEVYLADQDVDVEMTPTERAVVFRFTYPATDSAFLVVDGYDHGSHISIQPDGRTIIGYSSRNSGGVASGFRNWFILVADHPFEDRHTWHGRQLDSSGVEADGDHVGALVRFKPLHRGEQVQVKVASSFISLEQAKLNLAREVGSAGYDSVAAMAKRTWRRALGRLEVQGGSVDQVRTFYSSLYRMLFFPMKLYEIDATGQPVHYSPYTGAVCPGYLYGGTGFWDTFRALYPFLNLVYPSINREMQAGLLNVYKEGGWLPEWSSPGYRDIMVGNNSASVVADAFVKGVGGYDASLLYEAVQKGSGSEGPIGAVGRAGAAWYNRLGYVPRDVGINESAARSLEYAYDDFCAWKMAVGLHRPANEITYYARRSQNYRQLFDTSWHMMRGKNKDGNFPAVFNPFSWGGDFTEGNSWHYTWTVFHDIAGLIGLMGGRANFTGMLDSVFALPPVFDDSYYGGTIHEIREMQIAHMGQYAHGNQPIQHMIYLYDYAGQPWKTQYWVREVMNRLYKATPDGYCGDEDNGQTSAWYVFSALGFYPVCPATDQYVLGAPLFRNVTLHLENGKTFLFAAPGNGPANRYVKRAVLNGKPYDKNWIGHQDILRGGTLVTDMAPVPALSRGKLRGSLPYSFSTDTASTAWLKASKPIDSISRQGYTLVWVDKGSGIEPREKDRLASVFFKVYPEEVARFNPASPHRIVFVLDPAYDGVAETWSDTTRFNSGWFAVHLDDIDVVTHEVMHIVQAYTTGDCPGWITEGIADYARYSYGQANKEAGWGLPEYVPGQQYTDAYQVTARFFVWLERHGRLGLVRRLDETMRKGTYRPGLWKEWTGTSLEELWAAYTYSPRL